MGDTTWVTHRRSRPKHLPCKGDREVWPSCQNWSSWYLGRIQPGEQKSYPHASLLLLWRRPPCARESSCLRACLPSWQDVAADHQVPGLLNAVPKVSLSHLFSCPIFILIFEMDPPAWVGQTRINLAGVQGHCPRRQPRSSSVAC